MNIWNFDGNDLTFSISDGKENLGYGTMFLSDIFGDKTLRKNIKIYQNPSALSSLATRYGDQKLFRLSKIKKKTNFYNPSATDKNY